MQTPLSMKEKYDAWIVATAVARENDFPLPPPPTKPAPEMVQVLVSKRAKQTP